MPDEMDVLLRDDATPRNDPGPPLNRKHMTLTVNTSARPFTFNGEGDTARNVLRYIHLAHSKSGSSKKLKDCHAAIKADKGSIAHIVFE